MAVTALVLKELCVLIVRVISLMPEERQSEAFEFVIDEIADHLELMTQRGSKH
jgi:hypothetical protein